MTTLSQCLRIGLLISSLGPVPVVVAQVGNPSLTTKYLQTISDQFQQTINVYTDADSAGNHFAARGEFHGGSSAVPSMDEISANVACHAGITCITATFDPRLTSWGGWYWMNGVLNGSERSPSVDWGNHANAGYDLSGVTELRFWARGAAGGEKVMFFCCGVGYDPTTQAITAPYPDSAKRQDTGVVQLTRDWKRYSLSLAGKGLDLHSIAGGFGWVVNAEDIPGRQPITFYLDDIQYVKARPNDKRFLVSYETIKSDNPFDVVERNAAFVYDNSLALMAFVAAGDNDRARTIADSLVYAHRNDRYFTDLRVRNAYKGGDLVLPLGWVANGHAATAAMPGWYDLGHASWFEDESHVSTSIGNVAWAMMALLEFHEKVSTDQSYLTAAKDLGSWVIANAWDDRGAGGFTGSYDGWENGFASTCTTGYLQGQCRRLYKSTEHNIDLYSAFSRLYLADPSARWAQAAQHARHFFLSAWDPVEHKFWTGTQEDGVQIGKDPIPLDIQAWAIQALGTEAGPYLGGLDYIESHHRTTLGYGFKQNGNACGDWAWFEGTGQVALAYLLTGNRPKWQRILDAIHSFQLDSGAMLATDGPCLDTGFKLNDGLPWRYFPRAHVGATAWLSLAEREVNPYRAELYSPALSTTRLVFPYQPVGTPETVRDVIFSNPSVATVAIADVAIDGPDAARFHQTNDCGTALVSGGQCTFHIAFATSTIGPQNAAFSFHETFDPAMPAVTFRVELAAGGIDPARTYALTLQAESGTIFAVPAAPDNRYVAGTRVCLTVAPATGRMFSYWSGDAPDPSGCLTMDADKLLAAHFMPVSSPAIEVTAIPAYGSADGILSGRVIGAEPADHRIAALIFVSGLGWYTKPYCKAAIPLQADGSFSVLLTTGAADRFATRVVLLLLPASADVPCYSGLGAIPQAFAHQAAAKLSLSRPNPNERELTFSGSRWAVKASPILVGPGGNVFSDSPGNVFTDQAGQLHLRITPSGNQWACAEVISRAAVGYGTYKWTVPAFPSLHSRAVFGAFTWGDAEPDAREIDVEFGFSQPGNGNGQFVVQPYNQSGNLHRISIPTSGPVTFVMTWQPDKLVIQGYSGTEKGARFEEWTYPGAVPKADNRYENFRFNLWLNGGPPNETQEVIVSSFEYQPFVADPAAPVIDQVVNGASFAPPIAPGSIFTVFGSNLAGATAVAEDLPLPATLARVSVSVDGIPARLFYVSPTQINAQAPYTIPLGAALVAVSAGDKNSSLFSVPNLAAAPGLFRTTSSYCLAKNEDFTRNTPANPAKAGSLLMADFTGQGVLDHAVPAGAPSPRSPLSRPVLPASAKIGGEAARLDFIGLAPDQIGVGQVNVQVPSGAASGLSSLALSIAGVPSNACIIALGDRPLVSAVAITDISPSKGPEGGGTEVLIAGINFQDGSSVRFGDKPAVPVTLLANGSLKTVTPAGKGRVPVTVASPDGQSATLGNAFTYLGAAPLISAVAPAVGSSTGGTAVTVTGKNFQPGAVVLFGPANAEVSSIASDRIQVTTPSGFGIVSITVTNPDGQMATLDRAFTYRAPAPAVTGISPSSGSTIGGTSVSVSGSGFVPGATLSIGSAKATSLVVAGPDSLTAVTGPSSGMGLVDVVVTNPDGQSGKLSKGFEYTGPIVDATVQACQVRGSVRNIASPQNYKVVLYAHTNIYYIQPCDTEPTLAIRLDGTWGPADSHNGSIYVLLVRGGYSPPATTESLPAVDGVNVLAIKGPVGTVSGCDVARCAAR